MITEHLLAKTLSYAEYKKLLTDLLVAGKTTGSNQSEEYINYAKINLQRMNRLEKTSEISEELKSQSSRSQSNYYWLVLTEGWCGDAAQNLPVFHLIANLSPTIELKLLLRDEHLEIMDLYLTNGSRSIPKLICLEKSTLKELFVWGPRPAELQKLVLELLAQQVSKEEKSLRVQKWYNNDKTQTLQLELLQLLKLLK
jgi:hypothetical protein